jgi:hypothetical protein
VRNKSHLWHFDANIPEAFLTSVSSTINHSFNILRELLDFTGLISQLQGGEEEGGGVRELRTTADFREHSSLGVSFYYNNIKYAPNRFNIA